MVFVCRKWGSGGYTSDQTDFPETAVLVLTTFDDDESILGAISNGASGYLSEDIMELNWPKQSAMLCVEALFCPVILPPK
jgi:DNA-binding NarL/FixJ family response regulator